MTEPTDDASEPADRVTAVGGWSAPDLPHIQVARGGISYDTADDWDDDPQPRRRRTRAQRMAIYAEMQQVGLIVLEVLAALLLVGVIRIAY